MLSQSKIYAARHRLLPTPLLFCVPICAFFTRTQKNMRQNARIYNFVTFYFPPLSIPIYISPLKKEPLSRLSGLYHTQHSLHNGQPLLGRIVLQLPPYILLIRLCHLPLDPCFLALRPAVYHFPHLVSLHRASPLLTGYVLHGPSYTSFKYPHGKAISCIYSFILVKVSLCMSAGNGRCRGQSCW